MKEQHEDEALLQLALAHFAAAGVDGASMNRIAKDADITLGDLVYKYATVESLFDAAVAWGTIPIRDALEQIRDGDESPLVRLITMLRRLCVVSGVEQSALFAVYREVLDGGDRAERVFEQSLKDAYDALMGVIGEAQFRGVMAPLPPRFVLATLLSGVVLPQLIGFGAAEGKLHGVHASEEDAPELSGKPRSAMLAASLEVVFAGVLTQRARDEFATMFEPAE
jgi:AcrR family transcriptional regulator